MGVLNSSKIIVFKNTAKKRNRQEFVMLLAQKSPAQVFTSAGDLVLDATFFN